MNKIWKIKKLAYLAPEIGNAQMILNIANAFIQPFSGRDKSGRFKTRSLKKRKIFGVYFIKENGIIVYIGMSQSCLIKALYRHFYYYNDTHRRNRSYYNPRNNTYEVAIIETSKNDAPNVERGLILSVNPRDNRDKFKTYLEQLSVQNITKGLEAVELPAEETKDLPF